MLNGRFLKILSRNLQVENDVEDFWSCHKYQKMLILTDPNSIYLIIRIKKFKWWSFINKSLWDTIHPRTSLDYVAKTRLEIPIYYITWWKMKIQNLLHSWAFFWSRWPLESEKNYQSLGKHINWDPLLGNRSERHNHA